MTFRRRFGAWLIAASALVATAVLAGQTPTPATPPTGPGDPASAPLTSRIPVDPQITIGQLPNGLRYYVRRNAKPENRAELRLVVNAGSVLEQDDQRGLAHFVEHMAFNGTKNFPKLETIAFMESIGMRFGPSINAFTSFDETVYMLTVPTDKLEVVDKAMFILEDWAQNVSFDPEEIDKERGVIMEEWRLRRGAAARMQDKQFPVLLEGARYADRMPIGTTEVLQNFKHDRLIQFYRDWYRPDLMSVIAVGDFDPAAMEKIIRTRFSSIPAAAQAKPRPAYPVPQRKTAAYTIATDREQTSTQVAVYNLMPARSEATLGDYRRQIVESLFANMLSTRFSEMAQKPNAPFMTAGAGQGSFVRTAEASMLSAVVKEDGIEAGLEALFVEAERVTKFGFSASELDRQKRNILRSLERAVAEKDNQQSADLAAELSRNFLEGEPIPGIVYENALYQRFIPSITVEELNALAKNWSPENTRVVVVNAPDKPGLTVPDEKKLAAVIAAADGKATTPYDEGSNAQPLMATMPTPGTVTSVNTRDSVGITEWKLSNGATVILKPTTFKQDEIVFRAFSPGGTSLAADDVFVPASTASQVIAAGGIGSLSAVDLRRVMTGVVADARPSIGTYEEGLSGGASPKDVEQMFQLIHLRFTQPRPDPVIFDVMRDQTKAALANQTATPGFAFAEVLNSVMTQDHPRAKLMTPATVDQMNLDASLAFYKDRFADASDFTFIFVGTFEPATLRPFVEKYIASLPSTNRRENWKDIGLRAPRGVIERTVEKGIEPKSESRVIFTGPFEYDQAHRTAIRAMAMILQTRLRATLREDLGGTYSVGVSANYGKIPQPEYTVSISFGSSPERTASLQDRVFQEIELLKKDGPSAKDLADTKEALLREFETGRTQNGYLLAQLTGRYQHGESVEQFFQIDEAYRTLTAEEVQRAARTYLDASNYVKATLLPDRVAAGAAAPAVPAAARP